MADPAQEGESLQAWFTREVLVHERALMRFLLKVWPDRREAEDLRQEAYVKVYEAASKQRPAVPKAFLIATARHLMADRVRRGRIVSIELKGDLEFLNVLVDEISPEQRVSARQDLRRLSLALALLPQSYRDVVWMRKVEELPQRQVAAQLGISEKSVERRVARGVRLLAESLSGVTGDALLMDASLEEEDSRHG
jgi:RNA polymerase sigma factor (sigma-70 family)